MDSAQYADFCESRQLSFCKYTWCPKYVLYITEPYSLNDGLVVISDRRAAINY